MLNEWTEFLQYTSPVSYTATGKRDNSYLGRFTYTTLTDFEGMARILTILARGYLFRDENGNVLDSKPKDRIGLRAVLSLRGAVFPTAKKPPLKRSGNTERTFGSIAESFLRLWMRTAAVGSTVTFTESLTL